MIECFVKCTTWWAYYSSKMGNNFCPTPSENHKRTHIHPRTHSHTLGACNAPTALVQKIMIWFFYRQIKTNRKNPVLEKILLICLNSNLPLSLVFTITAFFKRKKGNTQALRRSRFAKFSRSCLIEPWST